MLNSSQINSIYTLVTERDSSVYALYNECGTFQEHGTIYEFVRFLGLPNNNESRLACADRVAGMREDSLINFLKSTNSPQSAIDSTLSQAFDFVRNFHEQRNLVLLNDICKLDIPTHYKILFQSNYHIGTLMSDLHIEWEKIVVNQVNAELFEIYLNKDSIISFLSANNLFDKGHGGEQADRCYSVLINEDGSYVAKTYFEAFPSLVEPIISSLTNLIDELSKCHLRDTNVDVSSWVHYFIAFKNALSCNDRHKCVSLWAQVDREWMKLDGPVQMVHPIEYYDDSIRNAVSIEWDLRIDNPDNETNTRSHSILSMFNSKFAEFKNECSEPNALESIVIQNIKKVQLHIGKQVFYSGSQYKGLASAQVIPNDEIVSSEEGKKIFAFSDKSVELSRSKPSLVINRQIFGDKITDSQKNLLFNRKDDYLRVYDITTIGHEYGHVLWKSLNTEIRMNTTGNFKNIEEFKASSGGVVAFFDTDEEQELWYDVFLNIIQRSVRLISWKNVDEVKPYYCESLITLDILFRSDALQFNEGKLSINDSFDAYVSFKQCYKDSYDFLITEYLNENNADNFLFEYVEWVENEFLPKKTEIRDFVLYYYELNQRIGRITEEQIEKEESAG